MTRVSINRPAPIVFSVDGKLLTAHPGETVAAAMIAAGELRFRDDRNGKPRGPFCNMGTCSECSVWVAKSAGDPFTRRRACLVTVADAMKVLTQEPEVDLG